MLSARISRIVMMVRGQEGLANAVNFYHQAIGLSVVRVTDDWAELTSAASSAAAGTTPTPAATTTLNLRAVASESQVSTGYSPVVTFEVGDMDSAVASCVQHGGHLDGPIQYEAHGKIAALRSPDGHMLGLYEPTSPTG